MKNAIIRWLLFKVVRPRLIKELSEASELYAVHYWKEMHPNEPFVKNKLIDERFIAVQSSFMDGYIKSLHDNNLKFENGKIVKNIKDYLL